MISGGAARALLRFELRQLRRHRARSWLVVALIAVPVAAVVGGGALFQITQPTPREQRAPTLGDADARVLLGGVADADAFVASMGRALPGDARVAAFYSAQITSRAAGRRLGAKYFGLAPESLVDGGLAHGIVTVAAGRAPERMDEVALSPSILRALELSLDDPVWLDPGTERRVVGVVVDPEDLGMPVVLSPNAPSRPYGAPSYLIGTSAATGSAAWVAALREGGAEVLFREDLAGGDAFTDVAIFVVGGLGFFEAALIIAAAFAVGFRRRQREIGLLGSVGATRAGLTLSMVASSVVLAVLGCAVGALVGVVVAAALFPGLDSWTGRWNGPFEVSAVHIVGALVLAIGTAVLAAAAPAWRATALPIRVALRGRRPVRGGASWWLGSGLAACTVGIALVIVADRASEYAPLAVLGGGVLIVLGLGAWSPALLLLLTRVAGPLPLPWRLAVRDAGRFRNQHGPVVAAVLAGMAITLLLAGLIQSVERLADQRLPALRGDQLLVAGPGAEQVAGDIVRESPGAVSAPLLAAHRAGQPLFLEEDSRPSPTRSFVACGDEALLHALGAERALPEFRAGHLIVLVPDHAANDRSVEDAVDVGRARPEAIVEGSRSAGPARTDAASPSAADHSELTGVARHRVNVREAVLGPRFLIATSALRSLSLQSGPPPSQELVPWLVRFEHPITAAGLDRARGLAGAVSGTSVDAEIARETPTRAIFAVVLLVAFVTGLIVIAIATALSAVESAADRRVLHAVGASPALLRQHIAARAGYLAFLGCALAAPAGCLPLLGLLPLSGGALHFAMPWRELLIAIVGFPAIAYGATWVFAWLRARRSAGPFARARVTAPHRAWIPTSK